MVAPAIQLSLLLVLRIIPQSVIARANRKNEVTAKAMTSARPEYIMILYGIAALAAMQRCVASGYRLSVSVGLFFFALTATWSLVSIGFIRKSYNEELNVHRGFKLVTAGPYAIVRHPVRLGLLGEVCALVVIAGRWWLGIVPLMIWRFQLIRSEAEDRMLLHFCGDRAAQYHAEVPALNVAMGLIGYLRRKRRK